MENETGFLYDAVLYDNGCHPQSHPDRMATIATLFGLMPPPVADCRVLELGCGDGTNLVPVAAAFPESDFVGIDLSEAAIASGQEIVSGLGLTNIQLVHQDLMDIGADLGRFDYILAHGLYSWVPDAVREKVLAICRDHLTADGVCFISFNAYPGYYLREMVRGMMRWAGRGSSDPAAQIGQGRGLIQFLAGSNVTANAYGTVLKEEWGDLETRPDSVLFHDELSGENQPFLLSDFVARAEGYGLAFLAEANFHEMQYSNLPEAVRAVLDRCGEDTVSREQLMDFARGRRFRQTLLCRKEKAAGMRVMPGRVLEFFVGSEAGPVEENPDLAGGGPVTFRNPRGLELEINYPLGKAALTHLARKWPELVTFRELLGEARVLCGHGAGQAVNADASGLCGFLMASYAADMVEFHVHRPGLTGRVGERPVAGALARLQASRGVMVTTLNYKRIKLEDAVSRAVIPLLDGTRDRKALVAALRGKVEHERLEELLETCLESLAYSGLLAG